MMYSSGNCNIFLCTNLSEYLPFHIGIFSFIKIANARNTIKPTIAIFC